MRPLKKSDGRGRSVFPAMVLSTALASGWCCAGDSPVSEVLKKTSETYRNLQAYQLVAVETSVLSMPGGANSSETQIQLAVVKPGKVRLAVKDMEREIILVGNGETTWTYLPKEKQFTQESVAASTEEEESGSGDEEQDILTETQNLLVSRYVGLAKYSSVAILEREDRIKFAGKKVGCYRIGFESKGRTQELWIDKESFLVLRYKELSRLTRSGFSASVEITLNLKEAELRAPPDNFFEFTPPEKARQVQALNLPGERVNLAGKPAAEFTLKDLQGEKVSLGDFRGKVVLLDFWATWCGPCREELPSIEKLNRELKGKGLVILGINDEDTGTAKSFLKKNEYTLETLMDSKREVHRMYGVRAIPTVVVISATGVVAARFVGNRSEEQLRAALKTAGLELQGQGTAP